MSEENNRSFFEFTSDKEAIIFYEYYKYIYFPAEKYLTNIEQSLPAYQNKMYKAKKAFEIVLSLVIKNSSSKDLIDFYKEFSSLKDANPEITEIILDSLYDAARYRASSENPTIDDKNFFLIFANYGEECNYLMIILEGMNNALMSLFEIPAATQEQRKLQFIKEALPIIVANIGKITSHTDESQAYYDKWLIHFISIIKRDLDSIIFVSKNTFRDYLTTFQKSKIQNMDIDQIQQYLASAAIDNPRLKDAKILLKMIGEVEFYVKSIEEIEKILSITEEKTKESNEFVKKQNKIYMDKVEYEPTEFLG